MVNEKDKSVYKISKEDIISELENSQYKGRYKIYNTCLEQNRDRWRRGKRREFEQSLVNDKLYGFAYIKFYLDDEKKYALVAGESASLNVNSSGSDVKFCVYPDIGAAKEWLNKNNKKWCQTEILIIRTNEEEKKISKKEAREIENYLVKTFGLCKS